MKHVILVWCPNTNNTKLHQIPIQIRINYGQEDAEVHGMVPQHCPVCDHKLSDMERDGVLMEIGDEADKTIGRKYPGMYVRVLPDTFDRPLARPRSVV